MSQLWHLYRLSQTDMGIDKKKKEKEELETPEERKKECVEIEKEITVLKDDKRKLQLKMKKLEIETDGLIDHRKKFEKKIYSGKTINPKEIQSWQAEVEFLRRKQNDKEEILLEYMEEMESLEKYIDETEKKFSRTEAEIKKGWKKLKSEKKRLEKEIIELTEKREKIAKAIEKSDLRKFEQLQLSKDESFVVAKIVNGACGGCFIDIPSSIINKVRAHHLVTCNNCMRIMYWEIKKESVEETGKKMKKKSK